LTIGDVGGLVLTDTDTVIGAADREGVGEVVSDSGGEAEVVMEAGGEKDGVSKMDLEMEGDTVVDTDRVLEVDALLVSEGVRDGEWLVEAVADVEAEGVVLTEGDADTEAVSEVLLDGDSETECVERLMLCLIMRCLPTDWKRRMLKVKGTYWTLQRSSKLLFQL